MKPEERRDLHEAIADAKNALMRAVRLVDSVQRANTIAKKIHSVTARVEALQNEVKP